MTPLRFCFVRFLWRSSVRTDTEEGLGRGVRKASRELEPEVADSLADCERKIEAALDSAWQALRKIHDDKLYKVAGYKSFEAYCEARWGYSKTHAYRLIDYSKLIDHLRAEGISAPLSEGVARPLMKLERISKNYDDFVQRATEAIQIAQDTAPKKFDVPQLTTQHVESAMQHFGIYRNAKRKNPDEIADELSDALARVSQTEAFKMGADKFHEQFGLKGCPSLFYEVAEFIGGYAERCGGELPDGKK